MPKIPRAGVPRPSEAALAAGLSAGPPQLDGPVVELDVREDLRKGIEPFSRIMAAIDGLAEGESLHLRATFEPVPLFHVLGRQGWQHHSQAHSDDDWSIWFFKSNSSGVSMAEQPVAAVTPVAATPATGNEVVLDVRGLEPPEPMVRTLEALETLPEGAVLVQHNVRVPQFLIPILTERGFQHQVEEAGEEHVIVRISRAG